MEHKAFHWVDWLNIYRSMVELVSQEKWAEIIEVWVELVHLSKLIPPRAFLRSFLPLGIWDNVGIFCMTFGSGLSVILDYKIGLSLKMIHHQNILIDHHFPLHLIALFVGIMFWTKPNGVNSIPCYLNHIPIYPHDIPMISLLHFKLNGPKSMVSSPTSTIDYGMGLYTLMFEISLLVEHSRGPDYPRSPNLWAIITQHSIKCDTFRI